MKILSAYTEWIIEANAQRRYAGGNERGPMAQLDTDQGKVGSKLTGVDLQPQMEA